MRSCEQGACSPTSYVQVYEYYVIIIGQHEKQGNEMSTMRDWVKTECEMYTF